jgi:hypothetical protein
MLRPLDWLESIDQGNLDVEIFLDLAKTTLTL